MTTLATAEELNDLRQAVLAGKEFSVEEYRRIIDSYRAIRLGAVAAAEPAATKRAAAAAPKRSLAEIVAALQKTT